MPSSPGQSLPPPDRIDLTVRGYVPAAVSGQMIGIGSNGVVHSVVVSPPHGASYRTQELRRDATGYVVGSFGGTILAFSDDAPAYELGSGLDTFHVVDLAGQKRVLAPFPKYDPVTGDLHLVARGDDRTQSHIIVTAGAFTRRARPIADVPGLISGLALTADSVVFFADGFVGIAPREGEACPAWIATGVPAPHPIHAHDAGDRAVLLALTPALERWTLHPGGGSIEREVLDATPCQFAHLQEDDIEGRPRFVWAAADKTISRHDLVDARRVGRSVRPHIPGDFAVVPKAPPHAGTSGAWLIGFVHDRSGSSSELHVIDAAVGAESAVAVARIPRPIPYGLRCTWIPSTTR